MKLFTSQVVGVAPDPQSQTERKALYEGFGTGFSAAIELVALTVLGYFAGRFLDGKLHTAPWLSVVMLSLGAVG